MKKKRIKKKRWSSIDEKNRARRGRNRGEKIKNGKRMYVEREENRGRRGDETREGKREGRKKEREDKVKKCNEVEEERMRRK